MDNFPTLRTEPLSFYWCEDDLGSTYLSDRWLSCDERSLLEKRSHCLITATESAIANARLQPDSADELRSRVSASLQSAKPPPNNLSKGGYLALNNLKKGNNIQILPADKSRCTVVLNSTDYDHKSRTC